MVVVFEQTHQLWLPLVLVAQPQYKTLQSGSNLQIPHFELLRGQQITQVALGCQM
jgi:hypothetical protein